MRIFDRYKPMGWTKRFQPAAAMALMCAASWAQNAVPTKADVRDARIDANEKEAKFLKQDFSTNALRGMAPDQAKARLNAAAAASTALHDSRVRLYQAQREEWQKDLDALGPDGNRVVAILPDVERDIEQLNAELRKLRGANDAASRAKIQTLTKELDEKARFRQYILDIKGSSDDAVIKRVRAFVTSRLNDIRLLEANETKRESEIQATLQTYARVACWEPTSTCGPAGTTSAAPTGAPAASAVAPPERANVAPSAPVSPSQNTTSTSVPATASAGVIAPPTSNPTTAQIPAPTAGVSAKVLPFIGDWTRVGPVTNIGTRRYPYPTLSCDVQIRPDATGSFRLEAANVPSKFSSIVEFDFTVHVNPDKSFSVKGPWEKGKTTGEIIITLTDEGQLAVEWKTKQSGGEFFLSYGFEVLSKRSPGAGQ
jgi:hypothetical protein